MSWPRPPPLDVPAVAGPAPKAPDICDFIMSFMMVNPALLTASCFCPPAAPPDLSKSLDASDRAIPICEIDGSQYMHIV